MSLGFKSQWRWTHVAWAGWLAACSSPSAPTTDAQVPEDDGRLHTTIPGPSAAVCDEGASTYANFGEAFMRSYCMPCHSSTLHGEARMGTPESANFDSLEGVRAHTNAIDRYAAAGPSRVNVYMPLTGTGSSIPRPSDEERGRLGQWLACGAPE